MILLIKQFNSPWIMGKGDLPNKEGDSLIRLDNVVTAELSLTETPTGPTGEMDFNYITNMAGGVKGASPLVPIQSCQFIIEEDKINPPIISAYRKLTTGLVLTPPL